MIVLYLLAHSIMWSKNCMYSVLVKDYRCILIECHENYTRVMSAQKTTNTPTLNGGDRGGVWILLFSEVTLFEHNVSTILSPTVS